MICFIFILVFEFRLDKVLGPSKSIDSYESGVSLASRICKIERQVNLRTFVDRLSREKFVFL